MTDVLGAVSSVVQLIEASIKVINYVSDVRHAENEALKLKAELSSTVVLLSRLQSRLKDPNVDRKWTIAVSSSLKTFLDQVTAELQDVANKIAPLGKSKPSTISKLKWPFKKDSMSFMLSRISRLNAMIQLAMEENLTDLAEATKGIAIIIRDKVEGIAKQTITVVDFAQQQRHDQMIEHLAPYDFGAKYNDVIATRHAGTGNWFLNNTSFQQWISCQGAALWCPGIPGAGKTTMMAIAIEHLLERFAASNDTTTIYGFCDYLKRDVQNELTMIGSLWKQLMRKRILTTDEYNDLKSKYIDGGLRPTVAEMWALLSKEVHRYSHVYILLDALDEYPSEHSEELVSSLRNLQPHANIMITSRTKQDLKTELVNQTELRISPSDADMHNYIRGFIKRSHRLSQHVSKDRTLTQDIETTVIEKAQGMFLLTKLHMDSLATKQTAKLVRRALNALPEGSHAVRQTYDQALSRIETSDDRVYAERAIMWIRYSFQPLTIMELRHAISIETDYAELEEDDLLSETFILASCAGLVTVDTSTSIVRFVHYTTQEYFERSLTKNSLYAHAYLTNACLSYLSLEIFDVDPQTQPEWVITEMMLKVPFINYAASYWGVHAKIALQEQAIRKSSVQENTLESARLPAKFGLLYNTENCDAEFDLNGMIRDFADRSNQLISAFRVFMHLNVTEYGRHAGCEIRPGPAQKLNAYALFGLKELASECLDSDEQDMFFTSDKVLGNAMHWAAFGQHESMISLLLERDGDRELLQSRGFREFSPLHVAAFHGKLEAVKILCRQGADLGHLTIPENGWTPLHLAAEGGHVEIVKFILSTKQGRDTILQRCFNQRSVLHYAAEHDLPEIIQPLLQATEAVEGDISQKVDILSDETDRNTLHDAAAKGHTRVVKCLLDSILGPQLACRFTRYTVYIPDPEADRVGPLNRRPPAPGLCLGGVLPFQEAAIAGHGETLKAFLDWNNNFLSKKFPSLLRFTALDAAYRGHATCLKVLLGYLPDACSVEENRSTVLHYAADSGSVETVKAILEHSSDIALLDSRDKTGHTPLLRAAAQGHLEVCDVLLQQDCKTELVNVYGETALHLACERNLEQVLGRLIAHGCSMDERDNMGETPLAIAINRGARKCAEVLVAAGVHVEDTTTLTVACDGNNSDNHEVTTKHGEAIKKGDGDDDADEEDDDSGEDEEVDNSSSDIGDRFEIQDLLRSQGVYYPSTPRDQFEVFFYIKSIFRGQLALSVVSQILDTAEYWLVSKTQRAEYMYVAAAAGGWTTYLRSQPIIGSPYQPVRRVIFSITSHDQGWSDNGCKGTYLDSWTWFDAARETRPSTNTGSDDTVRSIGPFILSNINASDRPRLHHVCWPVSATPAEGIGDIKNFFTPHQQVPGPISRWIDQLRPGDRICIVPRARFSGWINYVKRAEIIVFSSAVQRSTVSTPLWKVVQDGHEAHPLA